NSNYSSLYPGNRYFVQNGPRVPYFGNTMEIEPSGMTPGHSWPYLNYGYQNMHVQNSARSYVPAAHASGKGDSSEPNSNFSFYRPSPISSSFSYSTHSFIPTS